MEYPKPTRSRKPNFSKRPGKEFLDLGWAELAFHDKRPALAELWCEDQTEIVTFTFSTIGLELLTNRALEDLLGSGRIIDLWRLQSCNQHGKADGKE